MTLSYKTINEIKRCAPKNVGQQIHINHSACPAGEDTKRRLYIKRTVDGVLAYCHHCNGSAVLKNNKHLSVDEIKKRLVNSYTTPTNTEVVLPDDATTDVTEWPVKERHYIHQWFDDFHVRVNTVCYSPSMGRVIFPYYQDGKLVFWSGRDVEQRTPLKWLHAKSASKPLGLYKGNHVSASTVILVEDVVSAMYVAEYTEAHAMCLYGTTLQPHQHTFLLSAEYQQIGVWLDEDTAGREAAVKIVSALRASTSLPIHHIKQPEPKLLSKNNIQSLVRVLNGH